MSWMMWYARRVGSLWSRFVAREYTSYIKQQVKNETIRKFELYALMLPVEHFPSDNFVRKLERFSL